MAARASIPPLRRRRPPLIPSARVRVVSVMTMSQRSFLPISRAIITLTHMELSIRPAPTQREPHRPAERAREAAWRRRRGEEERFHQPAPPTTARCDNESHEEKLLQLLRLCCYPTASQNAVKPQRSTTPSTSGFLLYRVDAMFFFFLLLFYFLVKAIWILEITTQWFTVHWVEGEGSEHVEKRRQRDCFDGLFISP